MVQCHIEHQKSTMKAPKHDCQLPSFVRNFQLSSTVADEIYNAIAVLVSRFPSLLHVILVVLWGIRPFPKPLTRVVQCRSQLNSLEQPTDASIALSWDWDREVGRLAPERLSQAFWWQSFS